MPGIENLVVLKIRSMTTSGRVVIDLIYELIT